MDFTRFKTVKIMYILLFFLVNLICTLKLLTLENALNLRVDRANSYHKLFIIILTQNKISKTTYKTKLREYRLRFKVYSRILRKSLNFLYS